MVRRLSVVGFQLSVGKNREPKTENRKPLLRRREFAAAAALMAGLPGCVAPLADRRSTEDNKDVFKIEAIMWW